MLLREQRAYFESRLSNIEGNIDTATAALDKRLDGMNEIRGTMKDQQAQTPTRTEVNGQIKALRDEFYLQLSPVNQVAEDAKKFMAVAQGKASQSSVTVVTIISVSGLLIGLIGIALRLAGL